MTQALRHRELAWSDDLALGVDAIDEQHKEWISLVHRFQKAVREGRSREEVYGTLAAAVLYTEQHFAMEQDLMASVGYPFLDDHLMQHDMAWRQIHAFTTGEVPEDGICDYLAEFLPQWLMLHINSADRKFARWLHEAEPAAEPAAAPASGRSGPVFADLPA